MSAEDRIAASLQRHRNAYGDQRGVSDARLAELVVDDLERAGYEVVRRGLLSTDESVRLVRRMLHGAIEPHIFHLHDGDLIGRLCVDPAIAFEALVSSDGMGSTVDARTEREELL